MYIYIHIKGFCDDENIMIETDILNIFLDFFKKLFEYTSAPFHLEWGTELKQQLQL